MDDAVPRILVVDDEVGMRQACRRVLAAEGYAVEIAEDGVAALELFEAQGSFAAALVDLKMPRMGGLELVGRLRELDGDVVLLVMTAFGTVDTAVEAMKRGANHYITKPFTPADLCLQLRNCLGARATALEARRLRHERTARLLEVAFERSKCNAIIECMADGVLVVNRDGQIVLRNPAAARIFPERAARPLPAPLAALDCDALEALFAETRQAPERRAMVSREVPIGPSTYMVNVSPAFEPSGEALGTVAVLRDITPLKQVEESKSRFASLVVEEIEAPLRAIEGCLRALAADGAAGRADVAEGGRTRAAALLALLAELRELTAIEAGDFPVTKAPLDLAPVVEQAVEARRPQADAKRIQLTCTCDADAAPRRVLADQGALRTVFNHLVDNALRYTPDGGHVTVRVEHAAPYVTVTVEDDGIGMSPEETQRAFDEFFRARGDEAERPAGTGLGLTLVRRLVDMHQGRITVRSAPGEGSAFRVSLLTTEWADADLSY